MTASSAESASTRPKGTGKAAPKASAMVLPPEATVALFTFCSVQDSTCATLAANTIRSAQLIEPCPERQDKSNLVSVVLTNPVEALGSKPCMHVRVFGCPKISSACEYKLQRSLVQESAACVAICVRVSDTAAGSANKELSGWSAAAGRQCWPRCRHGTWIFYTTEVPRLGAWCRTQRLRGVCYWLASRMTHRQPCPCHLLSA